MTRASACGLYELNHEDGTFSLVAHSRQDDEAAARGDEPPPSSAVPPLSLAAPSPRRTFAQRGLVGEACASGQIRLVRSPRSEHSFDDEVDNPFSIGELHSMAIAPCSFSHGGAGQQQQQHEVRASVILVAFNKRVLAGGALGECFESFSESDGRMLTVYSRLVGGLSGQLHAMSSLQSRLRSAAATNDIAMTLTSNLQGPNLFHNVISLARHLVPVEWSTLYVFPESLDDTASEGGSRMVQVREHG